MEAKEKADELINKYFNAIPHRQTSRALAKKCAIVAVDEMLWALDDIDLEINMSDYVPFWEEVKEEINKP